MSLGPIKSPFTSASCILLASTRRLWIMRVVRVASTSNKMGERPNSPGGKFNITLLTLARDSRTLPNMSEAAQYEYYFSFGSNHTERSMQPSVTQRCRCCVRKQYCLLEASLGNTIPLPGTCLKQMYAITVRRKNLWLTVFSAFKHLTL